MPLTPGTRLGPYVVENSLGEGGMGEVYQARDTKLQRIVALKILPDAFAADAERLARFRREALVLASLNHPNIASIHGVEDSGGTHALVMEFVPGRTLAEAIAGPMAIAEALPIARQIAVALEAAHEQGVVHRDLKPANVKVTDEGVVKVLDFGLAKAAASDGPPGSGPGRAVLSPAILTMTSPAMTEIGVILGTAGYMSPEQAKGKPADRRADIWALGVVLFEMLTGRMLYRGETVTETIAHVITQPPDWSALPPSTPAPVRRLLRRMLEKDPRNRLQSAGDVRIEIDECLAPADEAAGPPAALPAASTPAWRRLAPWALSAVLAGALILALWPQPAAPAWPLRLDVRVSDGANLRVDDNVDGAVATLSPDGQTLVFLAAQTTDKRLFARPLGGLESKPVAGTEGAIQQFFSPDSRELAFFSGGSLKRMPISGGAAVPIAPAPDPRGGTWGPDGTIVFTPNLTNGLMRVPSSGGQAAEITRLNAGERTHRWPSFLPNGRAVLFMCQAENASYDDATIEAVRLDTGARTVLVRGGAFPIYVAPGYLVYTRQYTVFAVRFDAERLEVTSDPQPVVAGIMSSTAGVGAATHNGASQLTVAANGTAAYIPGGAGDAAVGRLVIVDPSGKVQYAFPEKRAFRDPKFSPDGRRVALRVGDGFRDDIYILDPARDTLTRLSFEGTVSGLPVWTHDGQRIAYYSNRSKKGLELVIGRSDGTGQEEALTSDGVTRVASAFTPDDQSLLVSQLSSSTSMDIVTISTKDRRITPFLQSPASEMMPALSPDGKWIAYQAASAGGVPDVFVRRYPDGGGLRQVSSGGGGIPNWTKGGREIVYSTQDPGGGASFSAVAVSIADGALTLGRPRELFNATIATAPNATWYDVTADGSRFALLEAPDNAPTAARTHVTLILNFAAEIERALAGAGGRR